MFWIFLCGLVVLNSNTVEADSVLLLGGEVNSLLHPAISEVEGYGSCGGFEDGLPDLPHNFRELGAALLGNTLVVCGGYALLAPVKDCYSIELNTWPLEWNVFPPLLHGRHNFGFLNVGGELYAVGGSSSIGSVRSIERYNQDTMVWEEVGEMNGYRQDFCALPYFEDGIILLGGYDDLGSQTKVEVYNITTGSWRTMSPLNTGRGQHGCTWHRGSIVVGGGWSSNEDPNYPGQIPTKSVETYSVLDDVWTESVPLRHRRTLFGFTSLNGTLAALGGWEGDFLDTVELFDAESQGWEYAPGYLAQKKSAFAIVETSSFFQDVECSDGEKN